MKVELHNPHLVRCVCGFVAETLEYAARSPDAELVVDTSTRDASTITHELGAGTYTFEWQGASVTLTRERDDRPVASRNPDRDVVVLERVIVSAASADAALALVRDAKAWQEDRQPGKMPLYRWCADNGYWRCESQLSRRDIDTVILDAAVEAELRSDLGDFVAKETAAWYRQHCIPFRRGYLLHGPPGTGKTSLVHAIASFLDRPVYKVNLVAPRLCDDSLQTAVSRVDAGAVVVLEDIDALWGVHREKSEATNVTFSGLLNAVDGIGTADADGTLFVFTTNHPERLDAALRRKGRIDAEFRLGYASEDMARRMFARFYPDADASLAATFAKHVARQSGVTPARLQHHFIGHRRSDATDASADIELESGESTSMWG